MDDEGIYGTEAFVKAFGESHRIPGTVAYSSEALVQTLGSPSDWPEKVELGLQCIFERMRNRRLPNNEQCEISDVESSDCQTIGLCFIYPHLFRWVQNMLRPVEPTRVSPSRFRRANGSSPSSWARKSGKCPSRSGEEEGAVGRGWLGRNPIISRCSAGRRAPIKGVAVEDQPFGGG